MGAPDLLTALTSAGFAVSIDGEGRLRVEPGSSLTTELRHRLRESRDDLLTLLRDPASPPGYSVAELHRLVRLWHERAGLPPNHADQVVALLKRASPVGAESEYEHWRRMVADQDARISERGRK